MPATCGAPSATGHAAVTYGDFGGLTGAQYRAIEHFDFCRSWTEEAEIVSEDAIRRCGCRDVEAFRSALAKCHAYNLVKARRRDVLGNVLAAYGCSDAALESGGGTLGDALARVSLQRLLDVGWTFWSIPLGTFWGPGQAQKKEKPNTVMEPLISAGA
jgi:hypothetical protein